MRRNEKVKDLSLLLRNKRDFLWKFLLKLKSIFYRLKFLVRAIKKTVD